MAVTNKVGEKQKGFTGIYTKTGWSNGRELWLHSDGRIGLWYVKDYKDWALGTNIGTKLKSLGTINDLATACPYDDRNTWKYYDGKSWHSTGPDFEIRCQGKKLLKQACAKGIFFFV